MEEFHTGIYGPHMNGKMLVKKILRIRYYWIMMETDCLDFVDVTMIANPIPI